MADDLEEVRKVLFDTLRRVSAKETPMDIDRAKAICGVAQTIINSASVEVRALNAANMAESSGFFKQKSLPPPTTRVTGTPAQLPPTRVVDPLRQVKPAPRENGQTLGCMARRSADSDRALRKVCGKDEK